jgi:hypothetical protein
MQMQLANIPLN